MTVKAHRLLQWLPGIGVAVGCLSRLRKYDGGNPPHEIKHSKPTRPGLFCFQLSAAESQAQKSSSGAVALAAYQ